jgi:hypothetical protein
MTVTIQHNDLTIELSEDSAFNQTADIPASYDKVIQAEKHPGILLIPRKRPALMKLYKHYL